MSNKDFGLNTHFFIKNTHGSRNDVFYDAFGSSKKNLLLEILCLFALCVSFEPNTDIL